MARRPKPKRVPVASGQLAGGGAPLRSRSSRRGREEAYLQVETNFESLPVTPREIELLSHYLGDEIDALLRGNG
ncbi:MULTISPECIES: hypothetical protein [Hyphomicrobiales]|jgi:hypothetical protein|uniref:hypothetical protein n=1 Tax=Methylobacterium sp. CCH7-A2 TaxID=1768789 RepID=UPI000A9CD7A6|nr:MULTISPECIES: hypothetical protein [Hyphomicrobiales]